MALFTGPHRVHMEAWIECAPFETLLHIEIVRASAGRATLTMPFLAEFAQGAGLMHGGALIGLADTAVVMAIKSIVPPETHFATVALEAEFLHPVRQGLVVAEAEVTERVDGTLQGRATLYDEAERPVVTFSSTFRIAGGRRQKADDGAGAPGWQ